MRRREKQITDRGEIDAIIRSSRICRTTVIKLVIDDVTAKQSIRHAGRGE